MKTIIINVCNSNITRNFLRGGVFEKLKSTNNIRMVIIVPKQKLLPYKKEFESNNVIVEHAPQTRVKFIELFALMIAKHSISTHTLRQILDGGWTGNGRPPFFHYWFARILSYLGHVKMWRIFLRKILFFAFYDRVFADIFKKYNPDLVFSPTIYSENDLRLLKYCVRVGVTTIGMIKSWDNLTSKDFLLIPPDFLIVHNPRIKNEAHIYGDYPLDRIFVSGIPQFDKYVQNDFVFDKDIFFKKFNLDLNKKLILYSAVGSWLFPREREMIQLLSKMANSGEFILPSQVFVRLHPAYSSEDEIINRIQNIVVYRPGGSSNVEGFKAVWEFDEAETKILASTIKWSDVSINCGSTMTIESAFFDRPIVNIDFDSENGNDKYDKSVHRLYCREHYVPLVNSGGISFPKSVQELKEHINDYILNPSKDSDGRRNIVTDQCYFVDGMSGSRISDFIISKIK